MNVLGAIIAGIAGTVIMTLVLAMGPKMGMPKMDIIGMLGSMFSEKSNRTLGLILHFMMGIVFAIIYVLLWNAGIGLVSVLWGAIFGAIHWLISGLMMGVMAKMNAAVRAEAMEDPGIYMLNTGGMKAFMGGLIGHMLYGITVALVYGLFV
jgi:uncharacterized membrane protein YagU involved in acid resistance